MFIELHRGRNNSESVLVNLANVINVHSYVDGSAMLSLVTDRKLSVNETYEEVKRMIMEGK